MHDPPSVADLLASGIKSLDPAGRHYPLLLSRLKSRIAREVRDQRARAMLFAADVQPGETPAWMLSARLPMQAWIHWTKCLSQVVGSAQSMPDDALPGGRLQILITAGAYAMTLRGGVYAGTLTGIIELGQKPACRYIDEPRPRLAIERSTLPDTVLASIGEPKGRSNRGLSLGDIIDHPFVAIYDPPIMDVENVNGGVEIAFETGYATLAPVPVTAMRMVPPDADPGRPWALTPGEAETLRAWQPATALRSP